MPSVYLAGPIAGCSDAQMTWWRAEATDLLLDQGIQVFDPTVRDYRYQSIDSVLSARIVGDDKLEIRSSRAVLANCWKPGWGTAMEIMYAHMLGVPVVSLVAPDQNSPWIREHSEYVVHSLDRAIDVLRKICSST